MKKNRMNVRRLHMIIVILFFLVLALFITVKVATYLATNGEGPVITFDKDELRVKTSVDNEDLLKGVTAKDEKGNDVTDTVMIESMSKLLDGKKRIVNYIAYDANNNIGKASRTIVYRNYSSPKIRLNHSAEFYTEDGYINILDYVKVRDKIDGNISQKAQVLKTEYVDEDRMNYTVGVTNSCGDTVQLTIPATIHSEENISSLPMVQLDQYVVYVEKGEDFSAWEHVEAVTVGSNIYQVEGKEEPSSTDDYTLVSGVEISSYDIDISGSVDTDKEGMYKVTFETTYNEETANTAMLVVVE